MATKKSKKKTFNGVLKILNWVNSAENAQDKNNNLETKDEVEMENCKEKV